MSRLYRLLKHQSPRIILIKGERGSGRTSLLHAVGSQSDRFYSLTMFPSENIAHRVLEETFTNVVGFEQPKHYTQMVEKLVNEMAGYTGTLPLLAFDYPAASGTQLVEVFGRLLDHLRRLRSLVLITVTPTQAAAFPEDLIASFDDVVELLPLDESSLADLVDRRMAEVSKMQWSLPPTLARCILDETGGHVGRTIRLLRDLVDYSRCEKDLDERLFSLKAAYDAIEGDGEDQYSRMSNNFVPATPPRTIEDALSDTGGFSGEGESKDELTRHHRKIDPVDEGKKSRITDLLDEEALFESTTFEFNISDETESNPSALFDNQHQVDSADAGASAGANASASADANANANAGANAGAFVSADEGANVGEESIQIQGDSANAGDVVSSEIKNNGLYLDESTPLSAGSGPFGALSSRNKTANNKSPRFNKERGLPDYSIPREKPNFQDKGSDLWVADVAPLPLDEIVVDEAVHSPQPPSLSQPPLPSSFSSQDSPIDHPPGALPASLPSHQHINPNTPSNIFPQSTPISREDLLGGTQATDSPRQPVPPHLHGPTHPAGPPHLPFGVESHAAPLIESNGHSIGSTGLAGRLNALNQPQQPMPSESVPLNAEHLRRLGPSESILIETATAREFSPSDENLRRGLGVGRSRMSQLCNGLQKAGILKVRKTGRTRLFSLTTDAKAQLIAWGLLEG